MSVNDVATTILGLVAGGLAVWFFLGMRLNIQRAHKALAWMRPGLSQVSEKTSLRWMGTTGVILGMESPREPFKKLEVLVILEPRDVAPLWWLSRRNGRRDLMIMRGSLRRHAQVEADLLDPKSWSGRDGLARLVPAEWQQTVRRDGMIETGESLSAVQRLTELEPCLTRMGPQLYRCTIRRTVPHIEVCVAAPWDKPDCASKDVFHALKELGHDLLPT